MAAASATDGAIRRKIHQSGMIALIISNEEMKDIMKIGKFLNELDLCIKVVSEATENEAKEQKGLFVKMLLGTLATSLLPNVLAGNGVIRAGKGTVKAGQDF